MRIRRFAIYSLAAGLLVAGLGRPTQALPEKVIWNVRLEPVDARAGEGAQLVAEAQIQKEGKWHLYSLTRHPEGTGPTPTTLELISGSALRVAGEPVQPQPEREYDPGFEMETEHFAGAVAFGLPVKLAAGAAGQQAAVVKIKYQACNERLCLPAKTVAVPFTFAVAPGPARPDRLAAVTAVPVQPSGYQAPASSGEKTQAPAKTGPVAPQEAGVSAQIQGAKSSGLLAFVWLSLTMGFLALLTPCVFPMVPVTVSFFAKQQEETQRSSAGLAVAYCLGIIATFTGLGLLLTLLFGASGIQRLATNPWVNLGLAVLFVLLAANLFGALQLSFPGWLVQRTHAGSQRGRFLGPVLMGLTFSLTTFTCTVPFVGTLLATTTQGSAVWPISGMLAFSTAFASPFLLLALFPQWLAKLPKSGFWLVTVKAFMGFIELAAALKFLSNADLVWNWGLLTRPVFLAVWAILFTIAGLYLFGWLRLPHDEGNAGFVRQACGVLTLGLAIWSLAALRGRSLGELEAFLPPARYPGQAAAAASLGRIPWTEDYDAAVLQAKAEGKPLLLNFTGVTCTNCRWMEANMFPRPEVVGELEKFIPVELYTDKGDARSARYKQMQQERYGTVALPLYVIVSPEGETLSVFEGLTRNPQEFAAFLREGQAKFTEQAGGHAGG